MLPRKVGLVSLRRRVVGAAAAVALIAIVLGVLVAASVHRSQRAVSDEVDRWAPAAAKVQALTSHLVDQETGERGYVITGDSNYLQPYEMGIIAAQADEQALRRYAAGDAAVTSALDRLLAQTARWRRLSAAPEITARQRDAKTAWRLVDSGVGKREFDALRGDLTTLQSLIDSRRLAASRRVQAANSLVTVVLWVTAAAVALIGAVLLVALRVWVLQPLRRLSRTLRRVAAGDLQTAVSVEGPPDYVDLAADADAMRSRILDELEASERARQALEQTGPVVLGLSEQLASRREGPIPGLRYSAALRPAEGILAGDWVDVMPLGRDRVALLLVDVSGHGASAGLEAVRLKHVLTTALQFGREPHEAMAMAAAGFTDDERFATGVIVVVDVATGSLRRSNAGHLSPRVVPLSDRAVLSEALPELHPTGPLLSSSTDGWETADGRLEVGELLLAFSDGLIEARDPGGREFGMAGMLGALAATTVRDTDTAVSACVAAVRAHTVAPHRDDITVIAASRDPGTLLSRDVGAVPHQAVG